jgi:TetR/AcrR family transcriptional regulator, regulator of cefoperazone and chloramphenicol sensitivity
MTPQPDDTRTRLLEAAGQVFAEGGFQKGTVSEICKLARANIAAVNYHFGSKENLYVQAVLHAHNACLSRVPMPQWPEGTPALVKLREFIHTFLRRLIVDHGPDWQPRLIIRELFESTDACATMVEAQVRPTFGVLKGILDELLPPETPPLKRRLIGFSIVGQILHYRLCRPVLVRLVGEEEFRRYDVELLTDHIYEFTVNALGLKKAPRRAEARS